MIVAVFLPAEADQVLFNALGDQPDYATRAVACAHDLDAFGARRSASAGRRTGGEFRRHPHRRARRTRAGRQFRRQPLLRLHTAYGDTINTAARLEGRQQLLGTRICVSADGRGGAP